MNKSLLLFALLSIFSAKKVFAIEQTDSNLFCTQKNAAQTAISLRAKIVGGAAVVEQNFFSHDLPQFEASLSPNSVIMTIQNQERNPTRIAFTGSEKAMLLHGTKISSGGHELQCRQEIPHYKMGHNDENNGGPNGKYILCMVDAANMENGEIKDMKRHLPIKISSVGFHQPIEIRSSDEQFEMRVHYDSIDLVAGLYISIKNKNSGKQVEVTAPYNTMRPGFMLALTEGDREKSAKFTRLACIFANDGSLLDEK